MSAKQSTKAASAPQSAEIPFHKTFIQEVRPPESWHEWLELAKAAVTLDQKLGLLHGAFNIKVELYWDEKSASYIEYSDLDRLEFFFGVADGWADAGLLDFRADGTRYSIGEKKYFVGYDRKSSSITYEIHRSESEQRQKLARKAFDMLAANFFKMPEIREDADNREVNEAQWMSNYVLWGPIFPIVQQFFKFEEGKYFGAGIRNLSPSYEHRPQSEKQAIDFLLKLAKFLWDWREKETKSWDSKEHVAEEKKQNATRRAIVDGAKPWMIEVLSQLRKLSLLEKWIFQLDSPCLSKLKEIALRNKFVSYKDPVNKDRKVATIDEACYLGSEAGWILKRYELMTIEFKRLAAIREAERARDEAAQRVEKLTRQK